MLIPIYYFNPPIYYLNPPHFDVIHNVYTTSNKKINGYIHLILILIVRK
jgi:hypothetical protein